MWRSCRLRDHRRSALDMSPLTCAGLGVCSSLLGCVEAGTLPYMRRVFLDNGYKEVLSPSLYFNHPCFCDVFPLLVALSRTRRM